MKKLGVLLFSTLAVVLMLGLVSGSAFAQPVGDASVYFVTYFSNNVAAAPPAIVRVINDGDTNTNLYADYYVFDDSQELQECCGCLISPDGVDSESVQANANPLVGQLTSNTLTSIPVSRGVIKVIGSLSNDPTSAIPTAGLHGFATHVQAGAAAGTYAVTETQLSDANLVAGELSKLDALCYYAIVLGSGRGVCSCTQEDSDF